MRPLVFDSRAKLSLADAKLIIDAAEKKAAELGVDMNIAVVDESGNLIAFVRMDGARITDVEAAINKASAAVTAGGRFGSGRSMDARGISSTNADSGSRGLPIRVRGHIVGAVGCSSGTQDEEHAVAQAGVEAFIKTLRRSSQE